MRSKPEEGRRPTTIATRPRRVVVAIAVLAALTVSLRAQAGQLDQQQNTVTQGSGIVVGAQTFTAGIGGLLDEAWVHLGFLGPGIGGDGPCDVLVQIRSVSGGFPTSTVLAATLIPAANLDESGSFAFATFADPATVIAGTQYAIVIPAACDLLWGSNHDDEYAGGAAFFGEPFEAGAPTVDDFAFRTFVVPLPAPTLTNPPNASGTSDSTPTFGGSAGTAAGDDLTQVTIDVYAGSSASGTPVLTLTADPNDVTGAFAVVPTTPLTNGTYTAVVSQAGANGTGTSNPNVFAVDAGAANPAPPVIPPAPPVIQPGPPAPSGPTTAADTTAPDTSITSGPSGKTRDRTPTFTFASNETNVRFECSADGVAFAPCTTPHTLAKLDRGDHTFAVRAIDAAGNADQSPAQATFKVQRKRHR